MLEAIKAANLALRFLLELGLLVALGYWGFRTAGPMALKVGLGIALPVVAAVVWILFGAPGASYQVHEPAHLVLEVVNRPRFSGDSAAWICAAAMASH